MRKQIGTFIVGVIAGMLLLAIVTHFNNDQQGPGNLAVQPKMFNQPGKCISEQNFKVFQALSKGYALAIELESGTYSNVESASGRTVLFYNAEGKEFEDGERIKMPKGKCAREVGTYRYTLSNGNKKEVPVVQIMDNDDVDEE